VTAPEAVYLGDTPYDITAAHKTGVEIIALRCGGWSSAELCDAEATYDTPAELLERLDESPLGKR
jgi:phosphoglycolate phosphatase-like HAD superfamily hydrolase